MQNEFVLSGFGGQGVMFAGQLLAYAGMEAGLEVTWIPSYGPEMRGGTAHCFVVLSDKPIGSPLVKSPKVALIFNRPSFDKYETAIAPDGLLVVNSSLAPQTSTRTDITTLRINATDIAYELGSAKLTNMILLSATLAAYPVIGIDTLKAALEAHIPPHRRDMIGLNHAAIDAGVTQAQDSILHQT